MIRTLRNEVLVRVIVRDSKGKVVDALKQEDFRLFDNGKPQEISHFAIEKEARPASLLLPANSGGTAKESVPPATIQSSGRYLVLVFDNMYTPFDGLVRAREAGEKFLTDTMAATDRVAIHTTGGDIAVEFTDDKAKLKDALQHLKMSFQTNPRHDCPRIPDYAVDRLLNTPDPEILPFIMSEAAAQKCGFTNTAEAEFFARSVEGIYRTASNDSLNLLERMTRRLATAPGERDLILVSPGFVVFRPTDALDRIISRALRAGVIISALDPEGLINPSPLGDASQGFPTQPVGQSRRQARAAGIPNLPALVDEVANSAQLADWDVLAELAESTGGHFFHNNNDIAGGFHELAAPPEVSYLLAFSPKNLRPDGKFHRLKIELENGQGLTLTARRGYFAPSEPLNATARAEGEIQDAVYSRDTLSELPVEVATQFTRLDSETASLVIRVRVDAHSISFRKERGLNEDLLTFVTVIFDRDGNYVGGHRKRMRLHLVESGLSKALRDGLGILDEFHLAPGVYRVREVVRESEGGALSAENTTVDIHF